MNVFLFQEEINMVNFSRDVSLVLVVGFDQSWLF